ncbi:MULTISPECIES: hypothetical protein [Micrococcaceae]|uniref:POSSIBLE MEMBRANE PROTEIN n=1 Tax=Arthrobacter rhombi TaxID=71253 RepID=A0A1R4G2W7_9MICC|nr:MULTISPECIES: hypothetical protein [Micrococcaceae]PCC25084.1 hypothetical protein CIK75_08640 [Glutamicibacter sp. BW78]SJM62322.1 POSSIBLE MEMBRANE PROTEIN [Arthrobacter rhombi]
MKEKITAAVLGPDGKPVAGIQGAIIRAIGVQRPLVVAYLRRLQRKHPRADGPEMARLLRRDYLVAVTGGGAAVGASAVVPGIGTAASLGLSAAATVGFLEASALYAQSLAELHGITTEDPEKARVMVMAILMGEEGSAMIAALTHQAAGRGVGPVKGWGSVFSNGKSSGAWGAIGAQVQKRFLRKILATQGASIIGRAIPFGLGAAVGGVGNRFLGRKVVESASLAFGPVPTTIPGELEPRKVISQVVEPSRVADGEDLEAARTAVERAIEQERLRRTSGTP